MAFNVPNVRQNATGTCTGPRHVMRSERHFSFVTILLITYSLFLFVLYLFDIRY